MTKDKTNAIWDRADAENDLAWVEMDEFLEALEVRGPASTSEQHKRDHEQFIEIQKRCNAKSQAIFERAEAGYPPTN